jgi:hypothetical protein
MPLYVHEGGILQVGGALAAAEDCCCDEGCEGCECTHCEDSCGPAEFQVVIGSMANDVCGSCATLNGTYTLTCNGACSWRYSIPIGDRVCSIDALLLTIETILTVTYIRVRFMIVGTMSHEWRQSITPPYDCAGASGVSISEFSAGPNCFSGGTCTVTAL